MARAHNSPGRSGDGFNRSSPYCGLPGWRVVRAATNGRPARKQSGGGYARSSRTAVLGPRVGLRKRPRHQPCPGGMLGRVRALRVRPRSIYPTLLSGCRLSNEQRWCAWRGARVVGDGVAHHTSQRCLPRAARHVAGGRAHRGTQARWAHSEWASVSSEDLDRDFSSSLRHVAADWSGRLLMPRPSPQRSCHSGDPLRQRRGEAGHQGSLPDPDLAYSVCCRWAVSNLRQGGGLRQARGRQAVVAVGPRTEGTQPVLLPPKFCVMHPTMQQPSRL